MEKNIGGAWNMIINPMNKPEIYFDLRDGYDTDSIVVREIWEENVYETHSSHFHKDGIVLDIGANIGSFSVYAASFGAKVFAIEPEPHNLDALKTNINLNKMEEKIIVCPYAISDYKGTAVIHDSGGGASIKDLDKSGATVEVMTLDNFFSLYEIGSVDVMKIDVEGSESEIILAASRDNINKCKYITMEFDIRSGNQMGSIVQKLSETHHVRTMGSWERGGMIFAWLY